MRGASSFRICCYPILCQYLGMCAIAVARRHLHPIPHVLLCICNGCLNGERYVEIGKVGVLEGCMRGVYAVFQGCPVGQVGGSVISKGVEGVLQALSHRVAAHDVGQEGGGGVPAQALSLVPAHLGQLCHHRTARWLHSKDIPNVMMQRMYHCQASIRQVWARSISSEMSLRSGFVRLILLRCAVL